MATTLYDRNGNPSFHEDDAVEAALDMKWTVHRKLEPRYFRENPDKRTPEQKLAAGVDGVHRRAAKRAAILVGKGELTEEGVAAWLVEEVARVKAEFSAHEDSKYKAIGEAL